jgi:predicted metal-binding membrane protein
VASEQRATPAALPVRDRIAVLAGLGGVTALAWIYLVLLASRMGDMGGMGAMEPMELHPWTASDFLLMFLMWAVMMVGMMLPSAMPMALVYAAVARKAERQGTTLPPTFVFIAGFISVWTLFSLGATLVQWQLERLALLSPMMVSTSPALGGGLLVAAGIYQLTPAKETCLRHCRAPAQFFAGHWRPGLRGAFRLGLFHGAFCLGCCWLLMSLLFFGGVMNLLWIAAITIFVLIEEVMPFGLRASRLSGVGLIALGLAVVGLSLWSCGAEDLARGAV